MSLLKKYLDKLEKNFFGRFLKLKRLQYIFLAIVFFVSIFSLLTLSLRPEKFDIVVGQRSPADIFSSKDIEDKRATEKLREEASESIELIYSFNPSVHVELKKDIEDF